MAWFVIIGIVIFFLFLAAGFRITQQQERRLVEFFGRYVFALKPGLGWIVPWVMTIRATIGIWEQTISLFETPVKVDFQDGSATPKGAEVFVRIKKPDTAYSVGDEQEEKTGVYRAIYEISNWRTAVRDLVENAIRSYLNGLTLDKGITKKGAGFDLTNRFPKAERDRITNALAVWGFELKKVTVMDFDLEPELVKARGEVQVRRRKRDASIEEREIRAQETMGALISMIAVYTGKTIDIIQAEINSNPDLQDSLRSFAKDLVTRQMSIDGESLTDIRTQGGEGFKQALLHLIAAFRKI